MTSPLVIGIDIGGTNTDMGLVSSKGKIERRISIGTTEFAEIDSYIDAIETAIYQLLNTEGVGSVAGIGIGAPNGNFYTGTVADAPNLPFKGEIKLKEIFESRFHCPVVVTNDANAAAYGEKVYGGAQNMSDFILVTLGTGVGSGIVVHNQLLYGSDGFAGELGHCTLIPEGRLCSCGNRGCLEEYASARGICQNYRELCRNMGAQGKLNPDTVDCKSLAAAADAADEMAIRAWAETGRLLGIALANAALFSSPQAVFLMGGPVKAGHWLLEPAKQSFNDHLLPSLKNKIPLLISSLPANDVAILGAAALVSSL